MNAEEWGEKHDSCAAAMMQRRALGPDATQADWYRVCDRGDWLLWQLERHPRWEEMRETVEPVVEKIVKRVIRRGVKSLRGVNSPEATAYRRWARRWLSGEDRSTTAAWSAWDACAWDTCAGATRAARAAASDAAWATARTAAMVAAGADEYRRQARDIHSVLPKWPEES